MMPRSPRMGMKSHIPRGSGWARAALLARAKAKGVPRAMAAMLARAQAKEAPRARERAKPRSRPRLELRAAVGAMFLNLFAAIGQFPSDALWESTVGVRSR